MHRANSLHARESGVPGDIQPLNDNIVVEITNVPTETTSGILLPTMFETDDDFDVRRALECRKGTVRAVGPGAVNYKGEVGPISYVQAGDTVIVGPRGGFKMQEQGKSYDDSSLYMFKVCIARRVRRPMDTLQWCPLTRLSHTRCQADELLHKVGDI